MQAGEGEGRQHEDTELTEARNKEERAFQATRTAKQRRSTGTHIILAVSSI